MKILLICGHGDGDPGACACGYQEATLVREIAPKLKDILSNYATVTLFDTSKNMYKYLKAKNSFDFKKYDYVLELHFNAAANDKKGNGITTGTEILVHNLESGTSVEEAIAKNISALGFKNRGVKKRANLLNMNTCKKAQGVSYALLETCFIDDLDDMNLYQAKKDEVINGIASGVIEGFGLGVKTTTSANKSESVAFAPYLVKVTASALNIRRGAGTNYNVAGVIRNKGVYTIVAEKAGQGSKKGWGKLKSGAGWISLDFCEKR